MKYFARLSLLGSGLGLFFLTVVPSFATVVGTLTLGGDGSITVTPAGLTFTENDNTNTSGSVSSTEVGAATNLTYAGGPALVSGEPVNINGGAMVTAATLTSGVPAVALTFPDEPNLSITLDSFGPGSSTPCSVAITTGESCSPVVSAAPLVLSPIILTATSTGTSAVLGVAGTATDGSVVTDVTGNFSATVTGETPEDLSMLPTYTTTYSATFVAASAVPEPRSISLVVLAGLLMGLVVKRRKSEALKNEA